MREDNNQKREDYEDIELEKHLKECKKGNHRFIPCDEFEPTCIHCGKFQ
jgi:hypothetical protein